MLPAEAFMRPVLVKCNPVPRTSIFLWTSGGGIFRGPTTVICRTVSLHAFSRTGTFLFGARVGSQGASVLPLRGQWRMEFLETVPLLIIDDLGMRTLPLTAVEELS